MSALSDIHDQASQLLRPRSDPTEPGMGRRVWKSLRRDPIAFVSLIFIIVVIVAALIGPFVYEQMAPPNLHEYHTYTYQDYESINTWPSALHWLGADEVGRDTLARLLTGLRVSLLVAAFVELINIGLG